MNQNLLASITTAWFPIGLAVSGVSYLLYAELKKYKAYKDSNWDTTGKSFTEIISMADMYQTVNGGFFGRILGNKLDASIMGRLAESMETQCRKENPVVTEN